MYCTKCGDPIEQNEIYCTKCGNFLGENQIPKTTQIPNMPKKQIDKKIIIAGVVFVIILISTIFIIANTSNNYYFTNNAYEEDNDEEETKEEGRKSKYSTIIITDNTYTGVKITNEQDANKLIIEDSVNQKTTCDKEIKQIEENIINKYGITAVNLCEMDIKFAKEIENVFKKVYEEYPSIRGNLTNLSLINGTLSQGYIAAFMPIFQFASSDTSTSYPWVIKTQILLNTTYFLNKERLLASVKDGSNAGHFPPNATMYSPVAHELAHYISFLAMMRKYEQDSLLIIDTKKVRDFYDIYDDFAKGDYSLQIVTEAYEKYKKENNTSETLDEWRASISAYAVAKDNEGKYIYDETIAEAFHDVYLNDDKAKKASKYVVEMLKEKLEG